MLKDLIAFIENGFDQVEGWVDQTLWEPLGFFDLLQREHGVGGGVGEIGVHHGRLLLGMQALKAPEDGALAIDVFGHQELNIDNSGKGSRTAFENNVTTYSVAPEKVDIIEGDSLMLRAYDIDRIRERHGRFSIFDVDGGHTAEHVIHDLKVAMELTAPGGIILVDDYINPWWPGVHEGVVKLYTNESPTFFPLFYGMNKLILTDMSHHAMYLEKTVSYFSSFPQARTKRTPRLGWDALTVALPAQRPNFEYLQASIAG